MSKTLEQRVADLEATNEMYRKQIQKLNDVRELENMMGRYVWMHEVQMDPKFLDMFYAKKQPDVSWEVAHLGYFEGRASLKRILDWHGPDNGKPEPGTLYMHNLTTPVIEIAEDGKTAKGVWISPGAETMPDPEKPGKVQGFWAWTRYAVDFIREDGAWKIWHYHVYRIFQTPADKNYSDEWEMSFAPVGGGKEPPMPMVKPDGPTTYDNPFSQAYIPELIPHPPEPYKTFSETFTYGAPKGYKKNK
jgi:hypothetical protein